jgi:uncharacterized protein (DUF433 family)
VLSYQEKVEVVIGGKGVRMKTLPGRIVIDPETCGGKPIFSGTRVPVYVVLELLANQEALQEILAEYPDLTVADLHDALTFARNLAEIPGNPVSAGL